MASSGSGSGSALRRGLPRVPGGEPWPPAGVAPAGAASPAGAAPAASIPIEVAQAVASAPANPQITPPESDAAASAPVQVAHSAGIEPAFPRVAPPESATALRRGLPRVPGGEPWPPAGVAPAGAVSAASTPIEAAQSVASAPANPQITPPESDAA
ncbi:MAG: cytochrome b/b6 domain-containing protein, partial [Microbacterium hominis]|nr:cytochrome b/b6 domain-containing protein [Microbacterium hominis]